ncbi:MAG: hypothetical protein KAJ07_10255 [Planctomycetes bacterium]|nr:hypothetical protein [Planctomycetota bacterium]
MKVYQDLKLFLGDITKEQIIAKIDALLPSTWIRDTEREDQLKLYHNEKQYIYSTVNNPDLPNARLWLASNNEGGLYVSNIVPCEVGELTMEEYNLILNSFVDVLKNDLSIKYELTKADKTLEDIMPPDVAQKLTVFSNNANKSTGYGHPCDFDRWLNFVIAFHQNKCERRTDLIERWLHEEAGWMWETASELACQIEYTVDLLERYDGIR